MEVVSFKKWTWWKVSRPTGSEKVQTSHQNQQPVGRVLLVLFEGGQDGQNQTSQDDQKPAETQEQVPVSDSNLFKDVKKYN